MSSLLSKYKKSPNVGVDSSKHCHPSKKHYRLHHRNLNKNRYHFDNDIMWVYGNIGNEEVEMIIGINKERWHFSDDFSNNSMKDGR